LGPIIRLAGAVALTLLLEWFLSTELGAIVGIGVGVIGLVGIVAICGLIFYVVRHE
jgi:hypothetical protein